MAVHRRQIEFFAAPSDLATVAMEIDRQMSLRYVLAGLFDEPTLKEHLLMSDIPSLGVATHGSHTLERRFLVVRENDRIEVEAVPQRKGGTKHAVDHLGNPKCVLFFPGGKFRDIAVIDGMLGTGSDDPDSVALYNEFARILKKPFKRVNSVLVGPEAVRLLDQGYRLTHDVKFPVENDLRRTPKDKGAS